MPVKKYKKKTTKRKRKLGFRARLKSRTGRKILKRQRKKGRKHLAG